MTIDVLSINNVFIREWLNGCLIPLNFCMLFIIAYTVWKQTKFRWGWSKYPGAASACALWWIFFADFIRAILAWAIIRGGEVGISSPIPIMSSVSILTYVGAGAIATCATMRCIYCLTPKRSRHFAWIAASLLTVAFITTAYLGAFDWLGDFVVYQVAVPGHLPEAVLRNN